MCCLCLEISLIYPIHTSRTSAYELTYLKYLWLCLLSTTCRVLKWWRLLCNPPSPEEGHHPSEKVIARKVTDWWTLAIPWQWSYCQEPLHLFLNSDLRDCMAINPSAEVFGSVASPSQGASNPPHSYILCQRLHTYITNPHILAKQGKIKFSTILYSFNFHFPYNISSNMPCGPSYGVYISQLVTVGRICSSYEE